MKLLIIGDGSAGRRYEKLAQERGHEVRVLGPKDSLDGLYGRGSEYEALIIASPPSAHRDHLLYGLGRNLPILCEGPVTYNPYSYEGYTAPNLTASNWRFVSAMRELEARLAGKYIVSAHLYFDWDLYNWRPGAAKTPCYFQAGMLNINLHEPDIAMWLFGPPERVHVESRSTLKSLAADAYTMLIKHTSGVLTTIQSGWHSSIYRRGITVQLRDGSVEELNFQSPKDNAMINESYAAVLDTWLDAIERWDLTVTPSLLDGYRAWQAINGVAY